jgi:hypothetical protein
LEISFFTKELRDICQKCAEAETLYGSDVAGALRRRIADLLAVDCYVELPLGNPRLINKDGVDCLIIDLCDGFYLKFYTGHQRNPYDADGNVDWKRVSRVKLIFIGRDNDSF